MRSTFFISLICVFFTHYVLLSQDTTSLQSMRVGGSFQGENRVQIQGNNELTWHEYRLAITLEGKPTEKTSFYSDFWIRTLGTPYLHTINELFSANNVNPAELQLREAYVDFYDFLISNLDLRIGRQRIAWGTADRLNPTDNLNPYDLEDIWDFGRHLGSDAIQLTYYSDNYKLNCVFIPSFTPAALPRGYGATALLSFSELPRGIVLDNITNTILLPKKTLWNNSLAGIRVTRHIFDFDFSLSYVYGRDCFPLVKKTVIIPTTQLNFHAYNELIYPRLKIIGIDFTGAIIDLGIWGEAAIFYPNEVSALNDLSAVGSGVQQFIVLEKKPYVKYVIGADYTFSNGIYFNGQYLHGFIHERGADNLENYIIFTSEWKLLEDKLKLIPFGGGIAIKDFRSIGKAYAFVLAPEITYYPVQNAEFSLGSRIIDGKGSTVFGKLKEYDELYVKVKYSF